MKSGTVLALALALAFTSFSTHARTCPTKWQVQNNTPGAQLGWHYVMKKAPGCDAMKSDCRVRLDDPDVEIIFTKATITYEDFQTARAGPFAEIRCYYKAVTKEPKKHEAMVEATAIYSNIRQARGSYNKVKADRTFWKPTGKKNPPYPFTCNDNRIAKCEF